MFEINYRDSRPIYEQIKEQLRKLLISGIIQPNEKLPSIREVASSLVINPNTIQRAYRELESEGYIYTITGRGSFASERHEVDIKRQIELLTQFDTIVSELLYLDETVDSLHARLINISAQSNNKPKKGEN